MVGCMEYRDWDEIERQIQRAYLTNWDLWASGDLTAKDLAARVGVDHESYVYNVLLTTMCVVPPKTAKKMEKK